MFVCYHVFKTYVIEKYVFILLSKPYVTIPLCSFVTLSSKLMSLKNYVFLLLSKPYVTIPLCSFVTLSSKLMSLKNYVFLLSMSKTSNIYYFNYLFNNYTLCCQTDVVRLIHTTSSDHCSYNGNHLILDIIQYNHRLLSSFYKPLIILCNLWTSSYSG